MGDSSFDPENSLTPLLIVLSIQFPEGEILYNAASQYWITIFKEKHLPWRPAMIAFPTDIS
jgi:hypothetical protein